MSNLKWFYLVGSLAIAIALVGAGWNKQATHPVSNEFEILPLANTIPQRTTLSSETTVKVENINIDFDRAITLYGEVNEDSVASVVGGITRLNNENPAKPIFLLIASPGGSVFAGEQVLSAMESVKAPVYTVCTSLCASMAAIIHQYGTQRLAYDRSILMFHDASGGLQGEVKKMHSMLTLIERKIERTDRYIAQRSNMSYEKFLDMHKYDLWIDAVDAKQAGLVDKIVKIQIPKLGSSGPSAETVLKTYNTLNTKNTPFTLNY